MNGTANMTKTELLHYWFDEVWTKGNLEVIYQMYGPGSKANGVIPAFALRNVEFHDMVLAIRSELNEIKVTFTHTMEQDDWLAVRTMIQAERADNGAPVQFSGQLFARFEGTRFAETHCQVDFLSLFEQLGQLPADTLPICLTGQGLRWI